MDTRHPLIAAALLALLAVAAGCVRSETRDGGASAARGGIAGAIAWPGAGAPPAFRVCALGSGGEGASTRTCVRTQAGDRRYRIDGLAADSYTIVAEQRDGDPRFRIASHVMQVQCIRAPCPPMPMDVTVGSGARVDGVDLNGFYDSRDDFPAMPAD